MISSLLLAVEKAALYVKNHPQILFALVLLIVIPLLFLYTGQQFLAVGKANQDRLQKDRVGLMHDTLSSLLYATNFDIEIAERELRRISSLNPDIIDYKIAKKEGTEIITVVALDTDAVGTAEVDDDLYKNASLRTDESIIFAFSNSNERIWSTYRALEDENGSMYFIFTQLSLRQIDALFASREHSAYFSLVFLYAFMIALAFWHIKLTDYRYLYIKAQKVNETKDLFTNMIAHELRAPLTAILGYGSMISQKTANQDEKKYSERIVDSANRLLSVVNDLLEVARLQSGKVSIVLSQTDVSSVIKNVVNELSITASEKHITLNPTGIEKPCAVSADPKKLHQAMTNILSNAIKYTEKGVIEISVEDKPSYVEIRVKDSGMGISSDDQKKLFAPFFRVTNADVSKITGTGLGMWITKEFLELMGAKIGVESIKGVGTHVVVKLFKQIRIS